MEAKKLVIIGANDFQNRLVLKAKNLGYETHVFAWEEGAVGKENADFFYPVSITEKEKILEICRKIKPCGVLSVASDLAVITVNYVAQELGLPANPEFSVLKCTNKYEMRRAFKENGIPVPRFIKTGKKINSEQFSEMRYPMIVKPTDRSGSRGIYKVYSLEQLQKAVNESIKSSFEKQVIVEEFLEGEEYSCECISYRGEHHFLAFTKKFTTGSPHYIETAHEQPSDIPKKYHKKIKELVFSALDSLEIKNGASHSEFKIDGNGNIGIIEIGARMGGDCIGSDLVYLSTGYDYLKMVIDVACGRPPQFIKEGQPHTAKIHFLFNSEDVREMERVENENPDSFYRISEISKNGISKVTDSSTRLGYYILKL